MNFSRLLRENRPVVILIVLVSLSLASLVSGTEATGIQRGISYLVTMTAYPFLKARASMENMADFAFGFVYGYGSLRDENALLYQNLPRLSEALAKTSELNQENQRLRDLLEFKRANPRFSFTPVEILESYKGTLTIDRGRQHGVEEGMAVVGPEGVVGMIIAVQPYTATVATLHHPLCRVGAMVKRSRLRAFDGIVRSTSSDLSSICTMAFIDMKDEVQIGDPVVTSPESLFPAGLPIGRVSRVSKSGTLWQSAEVQPYVDPYSLDEVFVVERAVKSVDDLAGLTQDVEAPVAFATQLPDRRTLQEKYAP
ncbi:MAG: rod shape-determining protein MreC [Candidatus Hydrogenedentes bacterium]|nr:rod shape-determining protein MreC [Candidatus Hydrogenedentota bacterium]